jgi:hypothetical protein
LPGVCPGRPAGQMHAMADVAKAKLGTSTWLALGAMALGVFVIANDFTALSVAIPRIEEQLHTTVSRAQWVINGYALVFGVLIVTGGRLPPSPMASKWPSGWTPPCRHRPWCLPLVRARPEALLRTRGIAAGSPSRARLTRTVRRPQVGKH